MAKILIVAEHDGSKLNPSTAKCVACASEVDGAEIDVVILASDAAAVASQAARYQGVDKVLTVERPENEHPLATVLAPQVAALAAEYIRMCSVRPRLSARISYRAWPHCSRSTRSVTSWP